MTASFLDRLPLVGAVRRNHALEHATMQVLAEKYKGVPMAGLSNPQGFLLLIKGGRTTVQFFFQ